MKWLTYGWWRYLFTGTNWPREKKVFGWTQFWCRMRGHPCGPVWQNVYGLEPNMQCRNCGDEL